MKFKIKYVVFALVGGLSLAGTACKDALDLKPQNSADPLQVFADAAGVNAAMVGVYGGLTSVNYYGLRYPLMADLAADNLAHVGTFPTFAQIKNRNILVDNVEVSNMWAAIYNTINRANNVIAFTPGVASIPAPDRARIVGEARFVRALCYFDLVRFWGDVPLPLTPTKQADNTLSVPRVPTAAVLDQVQLDLDAAETVLVDGSASRANRSAARALKARLALYRGQWQAAATAADQVIATPGFLLLPAYRTLYTAKNTQESLFEVNFDIITQSQFAFFNFPTTRGGRNEVNPSAAGPATNPTLGSTLPAAYEPNDVRRPATLSDGTFSTNNQVIPAGVGIKYFRPNPGEDNFIVLRLAEVLLTSAEAKAQLNDLTGATTLVNRIRTRAGLPNLTATVAGSQASLLNAIYNERRVELAQEGHRWFDLNRTGRAATALNVADTRRLLFPIPFREITNNPQLTQNPGY